ncbi:MAG: hypothetical protein JRN15_23620, partial [Nitrososphaerota archaeon]|nr:hypothetical protein [Nitrososphaerota archaeon]
MFFFLLSPRITKIDIDGSLEFLKDFKEGRTKLVCKDLERPSPLSLYILSRYLESEDYEDSPTDSVSSMRASIAKELVNLFCFDCGNLREMVNIGNLEDDPKCEKCGSGLMAVLFYGSRFVRDSWRK